MLSCFLSSWSLVSFPHCICNIYFAVVSTAVLSCRHVSDFFSVEKVSAFWTQFSRSEKREVKKRLVKQFGWNSVQDRRYPTGLFTTSEPWKSGDRRNLCNLRTSSYGFWSSKAVKGSVGQEMRRRKDENDRLAVAACVCDSSNISDSRSIFEILEKALLLSLTSSLNPRYISQVWNNF